MLADAQAISGIEYNIDSYADVVEAIHVIQDSIGIAGATAAEAENTISGSINSLQAALQNMLVGFGDADADMNMLCQNMVDATVLLVVSLVEGIGTALPQLIPAAVQTIITIVQGLIENLPMILEAALQLIMGLAEGLLTALPILIEALLSIILAIVSFLQFFWDAIFHKKPSSQTDQNFDNYTPILIERTTEICIFSKIFSHCFFRKETPHFQRFVCRHIK